MSPISRAEINAKSNAKVKALFLADGPAGDRARTKKKKVNAKNNARNNARNNAKTKERGRVNAEMRMLANPSMEIQILPVQAISSQSALILARTNLIPGLDGTLEELMGGSKAMIYIWLSSRAPKDEAFR